MMKSILLLVLVGCAAVLADNYLCPEHDKAFECFESKPEQRTCLTSGRRESAYVVCSKCKKKYEFCKTYGHFQTSDYPLTDCGDDYETTPCTKDNSEWSKVMKKDPKYAPKK